MKPPVSGVLQRAGRLWLNELELDLAVRCLRRDGNLIPLRAKTFDLLIYLVDRRERIVTKDELLAELWQNTPVTLDAVVQSVLDLRRSLGDNARDPRFIKTVSKAGYQWIGGVTEPEPAPGELEAPQALRPRRWILFAALTVLGIAGVVALIASNRFWRLEPAQWETAWWKLDEGGGTSIGESIRKLTGALPAEVAWTAGISGAGLLFSGRELVVRGTDGGGLPRGDAARTLTAWIKAGTTNGDSTTIFFS